MATSTTTTTTTTSTSTQVNQQLVVSTSTTDYNLGNYVTDVSLSPYLAPRIVSFVAYNMRPSVPLHVFFDSVNVDAYCAPGVLAADANSRDTSDYQMVTRTGDWGSSIVSNANGVVYGQLNIPPTTFKTGDRTLEVCDVSSIKLGNDAITTSASATYSGSEITVTKAGITLTTVNPQLSYQPITNILTTVNTISSNTYTSDPPVINNTTTYVPGKTIVNFNQAITWYNNDPIAQVFSFTTPGNEAGAFITKIGVFFKAKSSIQNHGCTLYICETSIGYPDTTKVLPFSTCHIDAASMNVSADASAITYFVFESPVFLQSDTNYAFVVKPDGSDPDVLVYFANLGDIDITTGQQVYSQPNLGTAFLSATSAAWTALQNEYIKFKIFRANFTAAAGTAVFNNSARDYLTLGSLTYANSTLGIIPGDKVYSSVNSTATTANTLISGTLRYFNTDKSQIALDGSTGNFGTSAYVQIHRYPNTSVTTPSSTTLIASAPTVSLNNIKMNATVPSFATMAPAGTQLRWNFTATANNYAVDGTSTHAIMDFETDLYDYERIVGSASNETAHMGGAKSLTVTSTLISDSPYISPCIDTVKKDVLTISNLVGGASQYDLYDEFLNYGNTATKYISQVVTLASGQDAQDLNVIISAYRPFSSRILVFVKLLSAQDPDDMSIKTWTPMKIDNPSVYSNYGDPTNFREFTYTIPNFIVPIALTGTTTGNTTSTTVTGVGTSFLTQTAVGRYINVPCVPNVTRIRAKRIVSIANNTSLTVEAPWDAAFAANTLYLVPPPTTGYMAIPLLLPLTGTVTASTTTNLITGSGTNFTTLPPGAVINIAGDAQRVVSVTNSTSLAVETPWSVNATGANASLSAYQGASYLNSSKTLFHTFNRFQIKIVLLSDDSARVPVLDDLRCLALQL